MKTHVYPIIVALCLIGAGAWPQNIDLTASVDQKNIALGDTVVLTVVLEVDFIKNSQTLFPQLPLIPNCGVRSSKMGWSTQSTFGTGGSSSISIMRQEFYLTPSQMGTLTVPALHVEYQGKTTSSPPITIKVMSDQEARNAAALNAARNTAGLQAVNQATGQLDGQAANSAAVGQPGAGIVYPTSRDQELNNYFRQGLLYLQAGVLQNKIYAGDVFAVRYEIYLQDIAWQWLGNRRLNLSFIANQELAGFQIVGQQQVTSINTKPVTVNGQRYHTAMVCQLLLQPQNAGKLTIPAWSMVGRYRNPNSRRNLGNFSGFSGFSMFDDGVSFEAPSNVAEVEVLPLPMEGRPASFSGAVGDFNVAAALDKAEIDQRDVVTLKIQVSGSGSVYTIGPPKLPPLARFEQFGELKSVVEPNPRQRNELWGAKTFELVLRPKEAGELEIPSIEYAFFDPKKEKYVKRASQPLKLKVNPSKAGEAPLIVGSPNTSANGAGAGVPLTIELNKDISFIPDKGFRGLHERKPLVFTAGFWGLQAGPLALILFAGYVHRRRERFAGDAPLARRRGARSAAAKRLKAARRFLKQERSDEFHAELSRSIRGFLSAHLHAGAQLNTGDHGLTVDDIAAALAERQVDGALIEQTRQLLDDCDNARYAPGGGEETLKQTYLRGEEAFDQLMRVLK